MAGSTSGQDEVNPGPILPAWDCLLFVPTKVKLFGVIFWLYSKSFIDQTCSVKMAGYWLCSFLTFLWTSICLVPRHLSAEKQWTHKVARTSC